MHQEVRRLRVDLILRGHSVKGQRDGVRRVTLPVENVEQIVLAHDDRASDPHITREPRTRRHPADGRTVLVGEEHPVYARL